MSAISQLLLTRFWPNFKSRILGPSWTDSSCHGDICPGNNCPGNICQYQSYLNCYWPEFDQTLKDKEIQKCYKKESKQNVHKINLEHKATAVELELSDRLFHTTPREAYITLKDHKPDFETRPSVRLINPSKPDIGQIAKQILDNIVKDIRAKSDLKQCTNTEDVIQWFESIKERPKLSFIVFDIESFYPSITPTLLNRALEWAENYVTVTPQQT